MAIPGGGWTGRLTRAALEGVGEADSGSRIGDYRVRSVANILGDTRRKKRTAENSVEYSFFICMMGRLPIGAEHILVA